MNDYENPWVYKDGSHFADSDADGKVGFVYLITCRTTGRMYVGKKQLWTTKTRSVNKKKKKVKVHSDWKNYYGSSKALQDDVVLLGASNFKRQILHLCSALGECSYLEAKEQFDRNVLLCDQYYNEFIGCKIHSKHVSKLKKP